MSYFSVYGVAFAVVFSEQIKGEIRVLVKAQIRRYLIVMREQILPYALR